jgi:hypothetical protein
MPSFEIFTKYSEIETYRCKKMGKNQDNTASSFRQDKLPLKAFKIQAISA